MALLALGALVITAGGAVASDGPGGVPASSSRAASREAPDPAAGNTGPGTGTPGTGTPGTGAGSGAVPGKNVPDNDVPDNGAPGEHVQWPRADGAQDGGSGEHRGPDVGGHGDPTGPAAPDQAGRPGQPSGPDVGASGFNNSNSSGDVNGAGGVPRNVTGSSAGTPPALVEAPAAAASGPAPDAAAAAPISDSLSSTTASATGAGVVDAPGPAPDVGADVETAAAPPAQSPLDDLSVLGSIGAIASRVTDAPSAARELLSTGTGRSVMAIVVLALAIACFLSVHRRSDQGDRKLAAARTGSDVARFR